MVADSQLCARCELKEMIAGNDGTLNGSIGTVNDATIRTMLRFVGTAGAYFSVPWPPRSISPDRCRCGLDDAALAGVGAILRHLGQRHGVAIATNANSCSTMSMAEGVGSSTGRLASGRMLSSSQRPSPLSVGTLYHVVGVHDGTHMKTYLNGTDVETWDGTASNIAISTEPLTIGYTDVSGGVYAYSDMADIRIYDKALSTAEVAALYAAESRWELYDATQVCVQDVELNLPGSSSPGAGSSASESPAASESASPSAGVSASPSLGPSGSVCWGHSTGVTDNDGTPESVGR